MDCIFWTSVVDFCIQIAQIIGKPDLAPAAWVKRLVTLCDQAPPTSYHTVKLVLENELGMSIDDVFDRFDVEPLGSASIAQVCFNFVYFLSLKYFCLCILQWYVMTLVEDNNLSLPEGLLYYEALTQTPDIEDQTQHWNIDTSNNLKK